MKTTEALEKIKQLAIEASHEDGAHHKQWGLVEIAKLAGAFDDELPDKEDRGIPW